MTISDIAKLLGVSVATVSRVINNKGYVKDETRKKIEAVIEENGYRPNAVARSLTRNDTSMIAVIMSNRLNPFFANVLDAIEEQAAMQGYSILFFNTSEDKERERNAVAQAMEHRVSGILLLPVVLIDRDFQEGDFDIVLIDNKKVVYDGVELLIESGHRDIGIITCPEVVKKGRTRLEGYIQCLKDHGLEIRDEYIYPGDFDEKSGYQACEAFQRLDNPPTAVLATCSSCTLGCIRFMNEHNLLPGKDLGLVGFDDISLLNSIGYELTVMDRPMQEMGEIAFGLLTDRMKGPAAKKRRREVMLRTRLIIRGSEKRQGVQEAVL